MKASLGTGILAMPAAFMNAGLVLGIFGTILVAVICTHCSYILVRTKSSRFLLFLSVSLLLQVVCAHELYKRTKKTSMSFADVAEEACKRGPKWSRPYGPFARWFITRSVQLKTLENVLYWKTNEQSSFFYLYTFLKIIVLLVTLLDIILHGVKNFISFIN